MFGKKIKWCKKCEKREVIFIGLLKQCKEQKNWFLCKHCGTHFKRNEI